MIFDLRPLPNARRCLTRSAVMLSSALVLGGCAFIDPFDRAAADVSPQSDPAPAAAGGVVTEQLDLAAAGAAEPEPARRAGAFAPALAPDAPIDMAAVEGGLFTPLVKVNDEIITGYDVQQRAALLRFAAGGRAEGDVERQALEELVGDALKLQEADRIGLEITDQVFSDALQSIARGNGATVDEMFATLARAGIDRGTLERQIRAQIVWNRILRSRYGERLQPTDAEIDAAIAEAEPGPAVYELSQIVVPLQATAPDSIARRAFAAAVAARDRISNCGQVDEAARSIGLPGAQSGRVPASRLPGPILQAISGLSVGQATDPLRSRDGVHIIVVCGVESGGPPPREVVAERLLGAQLNRFSSSLLDELRRNSVIEVR